MFWKLIHLDLEDSSDVTDDLLFQGKFSYALCLKSIHLRTFLWVSKGKNVFSSICGFVSLL